MFDAVLDLSHWQEVTDFAAVKSIGIAGVILKATQGSGYVDPTFKQRAADAEKAGLLVGAYTFLDGSPIEAQIEHFLAIAGHLPKLALDVEENAPDDSKGSVTVEQAAEGVELMIEATGRLPLIYMGRYGPDGFVTGLPNDTLAKCDLWLPNYGTTPVPPMGWVAPKLWQYTDKGVCPGVTGQCDRNTFYGTADELEAWWTVIGV